jgi:hypothetical protein
VGWVVVFCATKSTFSSYARCSERNGFREYLSGPPVVPYQRMFWSAHRLLAEARCGLTDVFNFFFTYD